MTLVNGGITILKITGKTNNYLSPFKNTNATPETNRKKNKTLVMFLLRQSGRK